MAIDATPGSAICHAGLAGSLRELGAVDRAFSTIGAALARFPDDLIVMTEGARIAEAFGRHREALDRWSKAIANSDPHPEWLLGRAKALLRLGMLDQAWDQAVSARLAFPAYPGFQEIKAQCAAAGLAEGTDPTPATRESGCRAGKSQPFKIVAVTRILDEADIVEAFVRHTAPYVDAHLFLDNGSGDGTLEILKSLKKEGFAVEVFQNVCASYSEANFNTFLYKEANKIGNGWTVYLDADEFIDDRDLKVGFYQYLKSMFDNKPEARCLNVALVDYATTRMDRAEEVNPCKRIQHRASRGATTKIIVRRIEGNVEIGAGSHYAYLDNQIIESENPEQLIQYSHFQNRSSYHFILKNVRGWAKVLACGREFYSSGVSVHYRDPFMILRDNPENLLENSDFINGHYPENDLQIDPIAYAGGDLLYTRKLNEPMRVVRALIGYLEQLALQHGLLISASMDAARIVDHRSREIEKLF